MKHMSRYLTRRNVLAALAVVVGIVIAVVCVPAALSGPHVVALTPADKAMDANPQAPIRVEFDQWVWSSSVAESIHFDPPVAFTVTGDGFPHPGGSVVLVQPRDVLRYGAQYRVTIDGGVRNVLGRRLDGARALVFTTVPYVGVASFGPERNAQDVSLRAPITVTFDAPVVSAELIAAVAEDPRRAADVPQPLTLTPAVTGVGRWLSPVVFGFYPQDALHAAMVYTATVRADVTPDGRARLAAPFAWQFATAAPLLVGARPYDGAIDIPPTGEVEVRLATDVDVASAGARFSLADVAQGTMITGTVRPGGGGFLFKPAAPLRRGARYEARLSPGISSTMGRPLNAQALTWSFTVIGDLEVASVEPPAEASAVLTDTRRVSVRFNHPVVALTTIAGEAAATPLQISPPLPGVGRWLDTSTFVFSPTAALRPSTMYEVRVAAGLQDQTGGALREAYVWHFRTIVPQVLGSTPAPGDQYTSPVAPVQVLFNQVMDAGGMRAGFQVQDAEGRNVPGAVTGTGAMVSFLPLTPLVRGASYTLVVAQGVRSLQGDGALEAAYTSMFRVAPLPQLLTSNPPSGATAAELDGGIRLHFSTPMDWGSVERNMTIEPKPTDVYTSGYETEFSAFFTLAPETDYRVRVGAAAKDAFGVALGQEVTIAFHSGSLPPALAIVGPYQIGVYNAYVSARVALRYVNVAQVNYALYAVDSPQALHMLTDYDAWQQGEVDAAQQRAQGELRLGGERNRERIALLDLGRVEPGLYYLRIDGDGARYDQQIMAVSPYALTVKRNDGELFVWAIDLASGKPVADLPLSLLSLQDADANGERAVGAPQELGQTDGDGVLRASLTDVQPYEPLFLRSSSGERFVFATTNWSDGINPWDFGLPTEYDHNPVVGSISTDRAIYRPQQPVYIRGVLRLDQDGRYALPETGRRAHVTINDANGSEVLSTTLPLSEFGSFNTTLSLGQSAALGSYSVYARFDDGREDQSVYGSFIVSEYRKPVFALTVTPDQPELIQGDMLTMQVAAQYYAGGAVAHAPLRWRLLAEPLYFSSDAAANYSFEDVDDAYAWYRWEDSSHGGGGEVVSDGTATTDAQGQFRVRLPAELGKDAHSRVLKFVVEVTDVDGLVIASEARVQVHAGAYYVGLRPEGYVAQVGQQQPISLIAVGFDGQPVSGRALRVSVYTREWFSVREQGVDGQLYWTSHFTDTLAETLAATTDAQGRASVNFIPKVGGSYRIAAESRDDGGHTIKASAFTWAYGDDVFWGVDNTNRIDLIADKNQYKPGDTANVLVPAPYKGMQALMTIERGRVIEYRLLTLPTTTEVLHIPITPDYAPNVYVSLVLVKPAGAELSVPDMRMGVVNLPVAIDQQSLTISVTPDKEQAGPRDRVTYTVKAVDSAGQGVRAEVALALVDKAVLALADDPNPTLTQAFYERRPLGVQTAQTLTALADRVTLKIQPGDKGGGGGGDSTDLVRRDFPDTAYWNPTLVTGDDGMATVSLQLPDNLTTWRMTARGVTTDTRVGQATQDLVSTRPLLVRPTLPRFLTVGDAPEIVAVVQNTTATALAAQITLALEGLTLDGPTQQEIQVPANGQAVTRWKVQATTDGQAKLRFTVSADTLRDSTEQTITIQRFATPEAVASAGQVQDQTVETIQPPAGTAPAGELDLELVPSLTAGIESGLTYLEYYPYEGTEQTVSRLLPNVVAYRLLAQGSADDAAAKAEVERTLAADLQRLYSLQRLDGGWGWWSVDESQPYLTSYVVQGLLEARKAGYGVEQRVLDAGLTYLERALDDHPDLALAPPPDHPVALDAALPTLDARAYVLFVLADAGRPDRSRMITLAQQRAHMAIYGRAYLLMALKQTGGEESLVRSLIADLMGSAFLRTADAHWEERTIHSWSMSSDTRTTALALQAIIRVDPSNFLIPNAVRYLMSLRDQGHWRTTQESALTLIALSEYIAQSGERDADYQYRATLDGRTLREGTIQRDNLRDPISIVIALADLKATNDERSSLVLQKEGKGQLYYTLRMRSYEDAAAVGPLDRGLALTRDYSAVDTTTLSPTGELITHVPLGGLVQVRLTIDVPATVHYLAIEDMLPAGLEALDASLKTVASDSAAPQLSDTKSNAPSWLFFTHTEIHDNRVTLFATELTKGTYHYTYLARATITGTFQTLPATASQMYAPEVFGRSAGTRFIVTTP